VFLAFVLRAGVLWIKRDNLNVDPDAYRAVAQGLLEGEGFSNQVTGEPTAFRAPLYPLVLAGVLFVCDNNLSIALLHLVAGTATVWLTLRIGRKLDLGHASTLAALLVAVDPLLLQYTTSVMTETVFTFLLTALLVSVMRDQSGGDASSSAESNLRLPAIRQIAIGALFGLCALCRPTIWPVALLFAIWWTWHLFRHSEWGARRRAVPWVAIVSAVVVVSPWLVRNVIVFHKPIVTTTHGGYTLLLGNNPVYYRQEVDQPFGTIWEDAPPGQTQQDWLKDVRSRMQDELGNDSTEPVRDRWMYGEAFETINDEPQTFLRACLLRFVKFWNVVPQGKARDEIPRIVVWGTAAFYTFELVGFLFGLTRVARRRWPDWMPLLVAIVGFSLVHLVFWTNARMRAPVIPAIALFCAVGLKSLHDAWRGARQGGASDLASRRNP
jgi:4-amino-4-deoxy-L-arabinose transferase-like glycosyltransferase